MESIDKIKQIPIREFLQEMGVHPVRENNRSGMYCCPFREDRNASLSVDYIRNVWFDHGLGEGGSIIDLVSKMENCTIGEAITRLEESSFSFYCNMDIVIDGCMDRKTYRCMDGKMEQAEPTLQITDIRELINPALLSYMRERRIHIEIAKLHCKVIHYLANNKPYFAIGFPNDAGGWILRNKYFKGCSKMNISSFSGDKGACLLFEGFMDFLSFLTLKGIGQPAQDCIVLNSVANLSKVKNRLSEYPIVYPYLDNDEAGRKATQDLHSFCKQVSDQSKHYSQYNDLNDYLCDQFEVKPQLKTKSKGLRR